MEESSNGRTEEGITGYGCCGLSGTHADWYQ
jgi:hypothetical protein